MKRWHVLLFDALLLIACPIAGLLSNLMIAKLPSCMFLRHGILCPTCGGTRCVKYLTQLRPLMAFKMNPYLFLTGLACAGLVVLWNLSVLFNIQWCSTALKKLCKPTYVILWAVGFVLFGILRNIL